MKIRGQRAGVASFAAAHRSVRSARAFRSWLSRHRGSETELPVRLFKVHALITGRGYSDALDEALCFGWIDGVRRSLDADGFSLRCTPRKKGSNGSVVNIKRVLALRAAGRLAPPGLEAAMETRFRTNAPAWRDFLARPPWYRRTSIHWVISANRPETRDRRLSILIDRCAHGPPIDPLRREAGDAVAS